MSRGVQIFGVPVLFVTLSAAGCGGSTATTAPSTLAVQPTASVALSAEPAVLRFEPVSDPSCLPRPADGTRVVVVIGSDTGASLRALRFDFVPDGGTTVLPAVIPIPGPSPMSVPANAIPAQAPLPTPGVAPLPTSMPIPLPQPQRLPFFASFGCGSLADGVLVITAEVLDRAGVPGTSQVRARVAH